MSLESWSRGLNGELRSGASVMTTATTFSGSRGIDVVPMRSPEPVIGIGRRFGGRPGVQMSCMPSSPGDCHSLTSRMTFFAASM